MESRKLYFATIRLDTDRNRLDHVSSRLYVHDTKIYTYPYLGDPNYPLAVFKFKYRSKGKLIRFSLSRIGIRLVNIYRIITATPRHTT
jgi:hypothetical protein